MKYYLLSVSFLFFIGCKGQSESHQEVSKVKTCLLNDAENQVLELKEVKEKQSLVRSISNNKRGISLFFDSIEIDKNLFYEVTVGYNSDIRFETYYTFYVQRGNCDTIKILDIISGSIVPLNEWRKEHINLENTCITSSQLELPYDNKINIENIKYDTLKCEYEGLNDFICDKYSPRYIPLPKKNNMEIILVPMDCGDFLYRFYMLTINSNKKIDDLYVEGEWYEPGNEDDTKELTSFKIDENYIISVEIKEQSKIYHKKYKIDENGKFVEIKK